MSKRFMSGGVDHEHMASSAKASVSGGAINTADDRDAMALPPEHVQAEGEFSEPIYRTMLAADAAELSRRVSDLTLPAAERLAAGTLLALCGDPRISTLSPAMVDLPAARAPIGLGRGEVERVLDEYRDTGILREWIEKETPRHEVIVAAFRIAKFPVTNQEFRDFLLATAYPEIPTSWEFGRMPEYAANRPVYSVSAEAADAYVRWLASVTGRRFRLPTEVEWEYAAAGVESREFPWGDTFDSARANTREAGFLTTTPVGMFPAGATPSGIYDLAVTRQESNERGTGISEPSKKLVKRT